MSVGGVIPIQFVKGWFNETLRVFLKDFSVRSRLVIHNDGDLFHPPSTRLRRLTRFFAPVAS
jgi:hypothetical protein